MRQLLLLTLAFGFGAFAIRDVDEHAARTRGMAARIAPNARFAHDPANVLRGGHDAETRIEYLARRFHFGHIREQSVEARAIVVMNTFAHRTLGERCFARKPHDRAESFGRPELLRGGIPAPQGEVLGQRRERNALLIVFGRRFAP
jgi:hypothetical protein